MDKRRNATGSKRDITPGCAFGVRIRGHGVPIKECGVFYAGVQRVGVGDELNNLWPCITRARRTPLSRCDSHPFGNTQKTDEAWCNVIGCASTVAAAEAMLIGVGWPSADAASAWFSKGGLIPPSVCRPGAVA